MFGFHIGEPMQTLAQAAQGGEQFRRGVRAETAAALRSTASADLLRMIGLTRSRWAPTQRGRSLFRMTCQKRSRPEKAMEPRC